MNKIYYAILSLMLFALVGCDEDLCMKAHHTGNAEGGCNFVFEDGKVIFVDGGNCTDSYVISDSSEWGVWRRSYQTSEQCLDAAASYKQTLTTVKELDVKAIIIGRNIGNQIWMAKNLNVPTEEGSWCNENKPENCEKYGRLYTWAAAMKLPAACNEKKCEGQVKYPHQGICPDGFHIPTWKEFKILESVGGTQLSSTKGWKDGGGTDTYGFSALPAGYYCRRYGNKFNCLGSDYAHFWTSEDHMGETASEFVIIGGYEIIGPSNPKAKARLSINDKVDAIPVRCIKD